MIVRRVTAGALFLSSFALLVSAGGCSLFKPKEKKPFAAECKVDTDCESLSCSTFGSICTKACTYDSECGGDLVCRDNDKGAGNLCAKAVGTAPNGVCMNGDDCQHGHCLKRVNEDDKPGICSKFCQAPADCPDKMKVCLSISDSGMAKFCLPGDEKSPPTAAQFAPPKKKVIAPTTATTARATTAATATAAALAPSGGPTDAGAPAAADAGKAVDAGGAGAVDAGKAAPADAGAKPVLVLPKVPAKVPATPKPG